MVGNNEVVFLAIYIIYNALLEAGKCHECVHRMTINNNFDTFCNKDVDRLLLLGCVLNNRLSFGDFYGSATVTNRRSTNLNRDDDGGGGCRRSDCCRKRAQQCYTCSIWSLWWLIAHEL